MQIARAFLVSGSRDGAAHHAGKGRVADAMFLRNTNAVARSERLRRSRDELPWSSTRAISASGDTPKSDKPLCRGGDYVWRGCCCGCSRASPRSWPDRFCAAARRAEARFDRDGAVILLDDHGPYAVNRDVAEGWR